MHRSRRNTTLRQRAILSTLLLRKRGNIPNGFKCNRISLTSHDLKTDGMLVVDQYIPWTACCQNDLTADQPYQPFRIPVHPHPKHWRQWRNRTEQSKLKSWPPLMRGLGVHKNMHNSSQLTLERSWQIAVKLNT